MRRLRSLVGAATSQAEGQREAVHEGGAGVGHVGERTPSFTLASNRVSIVGAPGSGALVSSSDIERSERPKSVAARISQNSGVDQYPRARLRRTGTKNSFDARWGGEGAGGDSSLRQAQGTWPRYSRRVAPWRVAARATAASFASVASAAVRVRSGARKRSANVSDFESSGSPRPR